MSNSSLWVIDKNYHGQEIEEFKNSWLFAPMAWDILFDKYIPKKPQEGKGTFLSATRFDKGLWGTLNNKINNSEILEDRILWELSNQLIFFSKDKDLIATCIVKFLETNATFAVDLGEHIHVRYKEVAAEIRAIDAEENPCFVFKNTSCDDNVEWWFKKYNEDEDEREPRALSEIKNELVTEFVIIENNKIVNFVSNLDYFAKKEVCENEI